VSEPTPAGGHEPPVTPVPAGVPDAPVPPAAAPEDAVPARGMRAIEAEHFSFLDAVGGVRGIVEAVLPGLLFVVVFVASGQQLRPALVAAVAAVVVAVVARLAQRTPVTQALSGAVGIGIGALIATQTGRAQDFYLWGLLVNAAYLVPFAASALAGWPLVGLVLGLFRADGPLQAEGSWSGALAWRRDPELRRRYTWATWLWAAMFALRLAVQVPLYLAGQVAWLGTAKLVMGVPLTALVLWASWILVRGSTAARPGPPRTRPAP